MKRRLPLGIQTFREIRERNCYYVDKTGYLDRLLDEGKHWFLSRPRRFGKSLFLDTVKEFFEGNEELFRGLHIHRRRDCAQPHPVVRLSFAGGNFATPGYLPKNVIAQLGGIERARSISGRYDTAADRLRDLLETLHRDTGQRVAVLVDEYDKPILDALEKPELARANRDELSGVYGVIKDADARVRCGRLTAAANGPTVPDDGRNGQRTGAWRCVRRRRLRATGPILDAAPGGRGAGQHRALYPRSGAVRAGHRRVLREQGAPGNLEATHPPA